MRRRWVYIKGEAIEVTEDYQGESRQASTDSILWNDRLYQDQGDHRFASRAQHREYMRRNNLTTADDYTETWKKDAAARAEFFTTGKDKSRIQDVIDAVNRPRSGERSRDIIPKE